MFDNVNNKKINNEESKLDNSNLPKHEDVSGNKAAEDIFAGTDVEAISQSAKPSVAKAMDGKPAFAEATAGKPEVFQPKQKESEGLPPEAVNSKFKIEDVKKYLILLAIAFGAVILAIAGYWAYGKYFKPAGLVGEKISNTVEWPADNSKTAVPEQPKPQNEKQETAPTFAQPKDSDQDGLTDEEEAEFGTNSDSVDSDDDGLFDREEVKVYKTDPLNADTDGDGYLDGEEVKGGYNPNGPGMLFQR